nr:hypothetical protein [Streptomyces sp. CFMR 7]
MPTNREIAGQWQAAAATVSRASSALQMENFIRTPPRRHLRCRRSMMDLVGAGPAGQAPAGEIILRRGRNEPGDNL